MKMKKTIILICCIIIASMGIALTGCGSSSSEEDVESSGDKYADSSYVGTWEATVSEYEGAEYDAEEVIGATEFVFNADGTGKFIGDGLSADIEWEPTEDGLKFTDSDGEAYFTYKDGKLLLDVEMETGGFITVYFEKHK